MESRPRRGLCPLGIIPVGNPEGEIPMRGPGIEPGSLRWQRNILPINYPR